MNTTEVLFQLINNKLLTSKLEFFHVSCVESISVFPVEGMVYLITIVNSNNVKVKEFKVEIASGATSPSTQIDLAIKELYDDHYYD